MKIIICGSGQVGTSIAQYLSAQGHDIVAIDQDPTASRYISEHADLLAITGRTTDPEILEKAGANECEMLIAATGSDEMNMMTCQMAHTIFGVPKKIARIRHDTYLDEKWQNLFSRDHVPIDVIISPELEIAKAIKERINLPGAFNRLPIIEEKAVLIAAVCQENSTTTGLKIGNIRQGFQDLILNFVAIVRDEETIVPNDDFELKAHDEVYFIARTEDTSATLKLFQSQLEPQSDQTSHKVTIMGGGHIGYALLNTLKQEPGIQSINMIEKDTDRARDVATRIEENEEIIINGDGLDRNILKEANIENSDLFISVTENSETNILAGLLAKKYGAKRIIALTNRIEYYHLMHSLDIDMTINPRSITVSSILRHVRRGQIRADYSLRDGEIEIIEMEASRNAQIIHTPLSDLNLPDNIHMLLIYRSGEIITPSDNEAIKPDDIVLMMATHGQAQKIERLFAPRADYF